MNMTTDTHRTPDELNQNALICEKLLGLQYLERLGPWKSGWYREDGTFFGEVAPSFTTWAEAGLILEAFDNAGLAWILANGPEGDFECRVFNAIDIHCYDESAPHAVRFAALEYIKR